jgi:uncharacterized protein YjbI with pentapeptide repeats
MIKKGDNFGLREAIEAIEEKGERPSIEGETFRELNLQTLDFSGLDMSLVEFDKCNLTNCSFGACTFEGTYVVDTTIFDCTFTDCDGDGFAVDSCTLRKSAFSSCSFERLEWTDSGFDDCTLVDVHGSEALVERVTFRGGALRDVELPESTLDHVTLRQMEVESFSFAGSDLRSCYVFELEEGSEPPEGFSKKGKRTAVGS